VIGEVLVVGIPLGDADSPVRIVGVPTDEIDGVVEVVAVGEAPARVFLISLPGAFECLCVAVSNLNVDSCRMIDICTCVGVPQRFSDFFAALYQPRFSSKIAQMFSTFSGGVVAQLASSSRQGVTSTARTSKPRFSPIFQYFLEKSCTLLFRLIIILQARV
jgi:hypothetical protein